MTETGTTQLISVVVLTWNRKDDLMQALASVYRQSYNQIEVVLIDNDSTDDTRKAVLDEYPEVKYIRLPYNFGVIEGRNIGIANAKGDLILLLDDDAEFLSLDAFITIVDRFACEPELAVMFFDYVLDNGEQWEWSFAYRKSPELVNRELYSTTFVGCAHCIRKKWLDKTGYFKREFFREGEEADYSYRIILNGGRVLYFPKVKVLHHLNPNQRVHSNQQAYNIAHRTENDLIYLELKEALITLAWRLTTAIPRSLKENWFGGYLLGCWRLFISIPRIFRSRNPLGSEVMSLHRTLRCYAVLDITSAYEINSSLRNWIYVRRTHQALGLIGEYSLEELEMEQGSINAG